MRKITARTRSIAIGACAVAVSVALPAAVLAAGDGDDHLAPKNKPISAALKPGKVATFTASVKDAKTSAVSTETVSCKSGSFTFTSTGAFSFPISTPQFSGCTDTTSGSKAAPQVMTNGSWTAKFIDAPQDETKAEPAPGDKISLHVPTNGITIKEKSCSLTGPTAPAKLTGRYNDIKRLKFKNASFAVQGNAKTNSGCSANGPVTFSATFILSPGIHDKS